MIGRTLIAIGLVAAAAGCAADPPGPPPGHGRMLDELAAIGKEAREGGNPYFGEEPARRLREQAAALSATASVPERYRVHSGLARRELRLGREQKSIEQYGLALEALRSLGDRVPLEPYLETLYSKAVAHMRRAETQNCIEHHTSDSCIFPIRDAGVHVDPASMKQAATLLAEVLKGAPPRTRLWVKAIWLLNVAHMTLGNWPDGVPREYLIPPERLASDEQFPRFEDVAPELGLAAFDLAGGAIVDDFDGDGRLDVMTSTSDTSGPMHLWRGVGGGRFEERTDEAGLGGLVGGLNMVHADYDNDGDVDVYVLRGAWWRQWGAHPNSLLRNDGSGRFTDVTFDAGLGDVHYPTQTAGWADYDGDGDLDLYVGNETDLRADRSIDFGSSVEEMPFNVRAPGQLFRNDGDGTFTDVAAAAGVENLRYAKGVAWGDYDNDGDPDLFVSNMGGANRLYRNEGDGTFTDVAESAGVEQPYASFPAWFWDANNDGSLDLFVAAYGGPRLPADLASVAAGRLGIPDPGGERMKLYLGDGHGGFRDVALEWGIDRAILPMGSNYGDLDNDGWPDVYLGTGYPYYEGLMPNEMFRNREGRGFSDVTTAGGFGHLQKGHGVAFADLDDDGDQDVFAQLGGAYPGDAFGNALFRNPGFGNHWVVLKLVGVRSNRSAIGARIRVNVIEDGSPRTIHAVVGGGGSFGGNPLRAELGLGRATRIESLEIDWPASGLEQRFDDLAVDRRYEIVEDRAAPRELPEVSRP